MLQANWNKKGIIMERLCSWFLPSENPQEGKSDWLSLVSPFVRRRWNNYMRLQPEDVMIVILLPSAEISHW
jgi:hypothetical protein